MGDDLRKGWLKIPGVQDGDRTLEEQMLGVTSALSEAAGKSVLDLGCAEGLLGREFARAGAVSVHGVDSLEEHLKVARSQCVGLPMTFEQADLQKVARVAVEGGAVKQYDIVLSLGVAHKLQFPEHGVRYSALSSRYLVLFRLSAHPESWDGILRSKFYPNNSVNVEVVMRSCGFVLERVEQGPREEGVHHYRRKS